MISIRCCGEFTPWLCICYNNLKTRIILLAILFFSGFEAGKAQQLPPALKSHESFLMEIANKKWECSLTAYPRVRFFEDKIDVLAGDGSTTSTLTKITHLEPGVIQVNSRDNVILFVFADDLQTFAVASMREMSELSVDGGTGPVRLPVTGLNKLLNVQFKGKTLRKNRPLWAGARIHADKIEICNAFGTVIQTYPAFAYYPHAQGIFLPDKGMGFVALSRKEAAGIYLDGTVLGTGVRTEKSGYFEQFLASKLNKAASRSTHFSYPLLRAGYDELAASQEHYAVQLTINTYGENSEEAGACWNEMGTLRGYARSYAKAPEYHLKALEHAKKCFSTDKPKLLDYSTDVASSQNDAGDFAAAKQTLSVAYPLLAPAGGDFRGTYFFNQEIGMAAFGLRNFPEAANIFLENSKRAQVARLSGNVIQSLLYHISCRLMQNQTDEALASLDLCMSVQDERSKANPSYSFDTWELAFACVALGKNKEAMKYSQAPSYRNSIAYKEYGRMLSLFHSGDRAGAQALAKDFLGRFVDIQEIKNSSDLSPVIVKLTQAVAEQSPAAIAALEKTWAEQKVSLKNRPLKNDIVARVIVATIAKLRSGS